MFYLNSLLPFLALTTSGLALANPFPIQASDPPQNSQKPSDPQNSNNPNVTTTTIGGPATSAGSTTAHSSNPNVTTTTIGDSATSAGSTTAHSNNPNVTTTTIGDSATSAGSTTANSSVSSAVSSHDSSGVPSNTNTVPSNTNTAPQSHTTYNITGDLDRPVPGVISIFKNETLQGVQIQSIRDGRCLSVDPRYEPAAGQPVDFMPCVNQTDPNMNAKSWDVTPGEGHLKLHKPMKDGKFLGLAARANSVSPYATPDQTSLILEEFDTAAKEQLYYVTNDLRISPHGSGICITADYDTDGSGADGDKGLIFWPCFDRNIDQMFIYIDNSTQKLVPLRAPIDAYAPGVDYDVVNNSIVAVQPSATNNPVAFDAGSQGAITTTNVYISSLTTQPTTKPNSSITTNPTEVTTKVSTQDTTTQPTSFPSNSNVSGKDTSTSTSTSTTGQPTTLPSGSDASGKDTTTSTSTTTSNTNSADSSNKPNA